MKCCDEGNGQYSFSISDKEVKQGGDFEFLENLSFKFIQCSSNQDCDDSNSCTTNECYSAISTCVYYSIPCDQCGAMVKVSILTDHFPWQTTWNIKRNERDILNGGPCYLSNNRFDAIQCLSIGTYEFNIFDTAGNGLANDEGIDGTIGKYNLCIGDAVIESGIDFGSSESTTFSVVAPTMSMQPTRTMAPTLD